MSQRVATPADVGVVARIVALAFRDDPVWSPALARPDGATDHLEPFWRPYVEGAMRYSTVLVDDEGTGTVAAAAVWMPPGGTEMTDEQAALHSEFVAATLSAESAAAMSQLEERFEASRPTEPHRYLSLLATHPDQRGKGIAQPLVAETLADCDSEGMAAYLESTNPANNHRYERLGFEPVGGFRAVLTDAWVTTMWRPAGSN